MDKRNCINNDRELRKIFAHRLKELRLECNLTLVEFSAKLFEKYKIEVTFGALGNYERAYRIPDLFLLSKISEFFSVTTDYLLGIVDIRNAKIIQQTLFDKENKPYNIKIVVPQNSKLIDRPFAEICELIIGLKEKGFNFDNNNTK